MLEKMSPEPSLDLDVPELAEVGVLMGPLIKFFGPIALLMMHERCSRMQWAEMG